MKNSLSVLSSYLVILACAFGALSAAAQSDEDEDEYVPADELNLPEESSSEPQESAPAEKVAAPAEKVAAPRAVSVPTVVSTSGSAMKVIDSNPETPEEREKRRKKLQEAYRKIAMQDAKKKANQQQKKP